MKHRDDDATAATACRLVDGTAMIARLSHPHTPSATGRRSSRPRSRGVTHALIQPQPDRLCTLRTITHNLIIVQS